jgi:hypothetical protein
MKLSNIRKVDQFVNRIVNKISLTSIDSKIAFVSRSYTLWAIIISQTLVFISSNFEGTFVSILLRITLPSIE